MLSRFNFHNEVRRRLDGGARLAVTHHARQRMIERDISLEDILRCLRLGRAVEDPAPDSHKQSTICRMDHSEEDQRISVVAGLPDFDPSVVVITVFGSDI